MDFTKFQKLNSIIKTCSFEMIPIGKTRETMEKHNVIEEDAERKSNAELTKEVSVSFIREFIADYKEDMDWKDLYDAYGEDRARFTDIMNQKAEKLAKRFSDSFNEYINTFLKANGINDKKSKWSDSGYVDVVLPLYVSIHPDFSNDKYERAVASLLHCSNSLFKKYTTSYARIIAGTKKGSFADRSMENFQTACANSVMFDLISRNLSSVGSHDAFKEVFADAPLNMNEYLSQKGISRYNEFVGASFDESGQVIRYGVNHYINEWNQTHPDERMPKMHKLKKQILSIVEPSFRIRTINDETELFGTFDNIRTAEQRYAGMLESILENMNTADIYDKSGILVTSAERDSLANAITGEWSYFRRQIKEEEENRIREEYLQKKNRVKTKLTQKDNKQIEDALNKSIYSVADLNKMLGSDFGTIEEKLLDEYIRNKSKKESAYAQLVKTDFYDKKTIPAGDDVQRIQQYLDKVLSLTHVVRGLCADSQDPRTDFVFSDDVSSLEDDRVQIISCYNLIRNFVTKKREKTAKEKQIQLCFGRPAHFEQVWNNKQEGKFGNVDAALLEYAGKYYYMVPAAKNEAKLNFPVTDEPQMGECYNYLATKKAIGFAKAFAKFYIKSPEAMEGFEKTEEPFEISVGNDTMIISRKVYEDYEAKTFRESEEAKNKLIDCAKEFLSKNLSYCIYDWSVLKEANDYVNYGEFCNEVDSIAFRVINRYVSKKLVDDAVERGNLYMFEISSLDMYKDSSRMKNIMALRFNQIMNGLFTGDKSIIINNAPQIRYRPVVIEKKDVHPVGSRLVNKNTTDGRTIPGDVYLELCAYYNGKKDSLSPEASLYNEKVSVKDSDREHIKDKHYTEEKFLITFSYTANKNVASATSGYQLNEMVRKEIRENGCNIMAVIRGIDNLLYYAVVDENGNRIEAGDLNVVGDTDFYEKLTILGKQRYTDQKNWKHENKVADLKDTYLGQVCRKIASIAVKNNAVIVIDKINESTKRKNAAFDNNMYRKFENALVNSLTDYYDIGIRGDEPGSVKNPLQLTVKEDNGFQNGIIFYQFDTFTKNICMRTGFVNLLNTFEIKTVASKVAFLKKLSDIYYDNDINEFVFEFTWRNIGCILKDEELPLYDGMDKIWKVRTHFTRYMRNAEKNKYVEIDGTEVLKELIRKNHPDMIGGKIDVDRLTSEEVKKVFEIFTLYTNGYIPRMDDAESGYMSPACDWNNFGTIRYDEMTALQLAKKSSLMIGKVKSGKDWKDMNVSRVEWLNHVLKADW